MNYIYVVMNRPVVLFFLLLLHVLLALASGYGSALLIFSPDGSALGMSLDMLKDTWLPNYTLPGIILFFIGFLLPLLTIYGLWSLQKSTMFNTLNIYRHKHWSWAYSLYTAIGMLIWIQVQQMQMAYHLLQNIVSFLAIALLIATLYPSVVRYVEHKKTKRHHHSSSTNNE